jgi:hypothetical protein
MNMTDWCQVGNIRIVFWSIKYLRDFRFLPRRRWELRNNNPEKRSSQYIFWRNRICHIRFDDLMFCSETVHLGTVFVNNQLDAQFFFMYVYFCSLRVSGNHVPIIRRINCINTTSDMSLCIDDCLVCGFGWDWLGRVEVGVQLFTKIVLIILLVSDKCS